MTLLVDIKCQDGVVIGSDGAATFGSPIGGKTIIQATSKLEVIGTCMVLGVSGPVGLGQSYFQEIEDYVTKKVDCKACWKNITEARSWLRDNMWKHVKPAWENAAVTGQLIGQAALQSVASSTLVALPIGDTSYLLQFDHQCQPEEATTKLPFVALGSGQPIADPFLAFIRRVFWPKELPSLSDGIFAAVWTLQHAIETTPGGVAPPIEIVTLSKGDAKNWRVKKFAGKDLGEHLEHIEGLQTEMRKIRDKWFTVQPTKPIPK